MTRTAAWAAVAAGLAFAAVAPADDLTFLKYSSAAGRFTIEAPAAVKESSEVLRNGVTYNKFSAAVSDTLVFMGGYFDDPTGIGGKDPQQVMKAFRSGTRQGAKITADREVTGPNNIPGRDYRTETQGVFIRERMFVSGTRFYRLIVVSTKEANVTGKDADRFFDSFQLTR
jgi:hypothetical protein